MQKRLVYSILKGQRYSCQRCGWCCCGWTIEVSPAEMHRLLARDWGRESQRLRGVQLFHEENGEDGPTFYVSQMNGRCAFLEDDNLCLIQKRLGEDAKPAICRGFPLVIGRTVEGVLVGANFACPSLIRNEGEPFARLESTLLQLLERADEGRLGTAAVRQDLITPEPALVGRTCLTWHAYLELERSLLRILAMDRFPLTTRVLAVGTLLKTASRRWPRGGRVQVEEMKEWLERTGGSSHPGALDRAAKRRALLTPARKKRMAMKIAQAESPTLFHSGGDPSCRAELVEASPRGLGRARGDPSLPAQDDRVGAQDDRVGAQDDRVGAQDDSYQDLCGEFMSVGSREILEGQALVGAIIKGEGRLTLSTLGGTVELAEVERLFQAQTDSVSTVHTRKRVVTSGTSPGEVLCRRQAPTLHYDLRNEPHHGTTCDGVEPRPLPVYTGSTLTAAESAALTKDYLARFLANYLLRKSLLESPTMRKGYEDLTFELLLARWYAAASAVAGGMTSVESADVIRGIQVAEKICSSTLPNRFPFTRSAGLR